jgi:uncharacterized protein (TIGR01619 family)
MKKLICSLLMIFYSLLIYGQKDTWDVYLAQYEKGPGSVTLNMDLIKRAPIFDLPYILVTGVKAKKCDLNGFPEQTEFQILYRISDSINVIVNQFTKAEFVGSFTYQCERLDYIYVKDTISLRGKLETTYKKLFPEYTSSIKLRLDKNWDAYKEFLYPNEETLEYMSNQKVINQLVAGGDALSKPRQVDHWIYFQTKQDRDKFINFAKENSFKIESENYLKEDKLPYQLRISRIDYVDLSSITKVTLKLKKEARKGLGDYDGWETFIVK